jgi:hypothetical protein
MSDPLDAAIAAGTAAWAGMPEGWPRWIRGEDTPDAEACERWTRTPQERQDDADALSAGIADPVLCNEVWHLIAEQVERIEDEREARAANEETAP